LADQIEINDIALAIPVQTAEPGFGVPGGSKQGCPEFFRIGFPDSNGCEYPRFVTASGMMRVQAVTSQLFNLDNGARAIWQLH